MHLTQVLALVLVLAGQDRVSGSSSNLAHAVLAHRSNVQMTRQPHLLLLSSSVTSSSSSSSSSSSGSRHPKRLRRLQQQQPALAGQLVDVPQCLWNEVREACAASQLTYLSVSSPPVTLFHRAAVMAYDRNLVCSGHPDAASCSRDRQNRCMYWNKSCVGMDAYELVNWIGGDILDGEAAVLAFTCKGTDAAAYKECATATDAGPSGVCNQLPGCQFSKLLAACVPKAWSAGGFAKVNSTKKGYEGFSAQVWGSCAGACYVRQASICLKLDGNAAACTRKPYCVYELDVLQGRQVCMHRDTAARAADPYSKELAKLKDTCTSQKSQDACEKFRVVPRSRGLYKSTSLTKIMTEAAAACPL